MGSRQLLVQVAAVLALALVGMHAAAQVSPDGLQAFPPRFAGEDCDALAKAVNGLQIKKDEFESSAAYAGRVADILARTTANGQSLDKSRLFLNSDRASAAYDAEKQLLRVYGSLRQSAKVSDSLRYASTVIVKTRSAKSSEYAGQNVFGVSKKVTAYRNEICGVAFTNLTPVTDFKWLSTIDIPLSPDQARAAKDNVAVVFEARLTAPVLVEYRQAIAPTMDSPGDILVTGDALVATLDRLYVINKATGEVLTSRDYRP